MLARSVVIALAVLITPVVSSDLDVVAQAPGEVVVVARGQRLPIRSDGLVGAAVGDINVANIEGRVKQDSVVIFGAGIGETTLDLLQHRGRRKRLTVRVVKTPVTENLTETLTAREERLGGGPTSPEGAIKPVAPAFEGSANPAVSSRGVEAASAAASEPPRAAGQGGRTPARTSSEKASPRRKFPPQLRVDVETVVLFDREDLQVVSSDLLRPEKLRATVFGEPEQAAAAPPQQQTITVNRSSVTTYLSFLYEPSGRNSLAVVIPFVRRVDEVKAGGSSLRTQGKGLGDVQLRFERAYPQLFNSPWEGSVEASLGLPTGKSIYNARGSEAPLGLGHPEVGGTFGAHRVFDPLTFNAAFGVSYTLPRKEGEMRISPGLGYSAQTGFNYALTDRWVLSEQLTYTRRPNVFLSSPLDARALASNQSSLTHGLVYRPRGGHALSMRFNLGLNPASSDYGFSFSYSYRGNQEQPSGTEPGRR